MNHTRILRQSLDITWGYRALWLFGAILALTTAHGGGSHGGGGGGSGGSGFTAPVGVISKGTVTLFDPHGAQAVAIAVILIGVALLLAVAFTVARVVAETALIRMVNAYEEDNVRVTVGQGFRLGWSRPALRIFLIDLIIFLGLFLVFALIFAIAAAPLAGLLSDSSAVKAVGVAGASGLLLLALALLLVAILSVSVLLPFFHRACVLEDQGVFDSFRRGWVVLRRRAPDVIVMALILFCIGLVLAIVFIPLLLVLLFGSAALASIPGAIAALIASLFLHGSSLLLIGLVVGLPIFLLIIVVPSLFLSGLVQVFTSSAWTLTYRDLLALDVPSTTVFSAV